MILHVAQINEQVQLFGPVLYHKNPIGVQMALQLEQTGPAKHPLEEQMMETVTLALGKDADRGAALMRRCRAAGVTWMTLLGFFVKYGSQTTVFLDDFLAALYTPVPQERS